MPIREYACRGCENEFEVLVRNNDTITCPECGSAELKKKLSVYGFVSSSKFVGSSGSSCTGCAKNNCGGCNH
jgi:putative FmdB family regulatory protein